MSEKSNNSNGSSTLAKLLNQLNLPTLALILLTGGGNWFVTKQDGELTREDTDRARRQLQSLYNSINDFENRQKETIKNVTIILDRQNQELKNQTTILERQEEVINQLHRWQQNYKNPER